MSNENKTHAKYFIIPKTVIKDGDISVFSKEQLNLATKYAIENKLPIEHGDLGRLEIAGGVGQDTTFAGYYRNDGLIIWNTDHFEDLDTQLDDYGAISSEYPLYEEPYYFHEYYWNNCIPHDEKGPIELKNFEHTIYMDNNISHNTFMWLTSSDEMMKNINVLNVEKPKEQKDYFANRTCSLLYTYFHDVRGKKHYIICDLDPDYSCEHFSNNGPIYTYNINGKKIITSEQLEYSIEELKTILTEFLSNHMFPIIYESNGLDRDDLESIQSVLNDGNLLFVEYPKFNYDEYKINYEADKDSDNDDTDEEDTDQ